MKTGKEIKEEFIQKAIEHGLAISIGDSKKANKLHKKIHGLYNLAKEINERDLFLDLLNNEDEHVRLLSATFSLPISPEIAENTLSQLSQLPRITAVSAELTLRLWKEGKLNLL